VRVTHKLFNDRFVFNVNNTLSKIDKTMHQMSTGKKNMYLSDSPSDIALIVKTRVNIDNQARYAGNIAAAKPKLNSAENQLSNLFDLLDESKQIAISAANGTESPQTRAVRANEINGILNRVFALANSRESGSYLFGGRETLSPPFVRRNGQYDYVGDGGSIKQVFSDRISIPVNVTGNEVFKGDSVVSSLRVSPTMPFTVPAAGGDIQFTIGDGINTSASITFSAGTSYTQTNILSMLSGALPGVSVSASFNASGYLTLTSNVSDNQPKLILNDLSTSTNNLSIAGLKNGTAEGVDIFRMLTDFESSVRSGDLSNISLAMSRIDVAIDQVLKHMGDIGGRGVQLNFLETRIKNEEFDSTKLLSTLEDVDFADAARRVNELQNTYQASLMSASKFMNISLLNFLR